VLRKVFGQKGQSSIVYLVTLTVVIIFGMLVYNVVSLSSLQAASDMLINSGYIVLSPGASSSEYQDIKDRIEEILIRIGTPASTIFGDLALIRDSSNLANYNAGLAFIKADAASVNASLALSASNAASAKVDTVLANLGEPHSTVFGDLTKISEAAVINSESASLAAGTAASKSDLAYLAAQAGRDKAELAVTAAGTAASKADIAAIAAQAGRDEAATAAINAATAATKADLAATLAGLAATKADLAATTSQASLDKLNLYNSVEIFLFPDNLVKTVTLTAGNTNVWSSWTELKDSTNVSLSSKFTSVPGYLGDHIFIVSNSANKGKAYMVEIAYGVSKATLARARWGSDFVDNYIPVKSRHIPVGETVYYRLLSSGSNGETSVISLRYFYE